MGDNNPQEISELEKLLFPEEVRFLTGSYRGYFVAKRHNFIATLNNHPDISDLYFQADENWFQAIQTLHHIRKAEWIVPAQLTFFCFRELRMAAELLFSCCKTQGFSHLRTALEAFTQAQKILKEPSLGSVWIKRDKDVASYNKHFKDRIKENLFPDASGFAHLHGLWKLLCDAGPHSNSTSLAISSSTKISETDVLWQLEFFETDQREITQNLILMISCQLEMLKHTYNEFHERMHLHPDLLKILTSHLSRIAELKARSNRMVAQL